VSVKIESQCGGLRGASMATISLFLDAELADEAGQITLKSSYRVEGDDSVDDPTANKYKHSRWVSFEYMKLDNLRYSGDEYYEPFMSIFRKRKIYLTFLAEKNQSSNGRVRVNIFATTIYVFVDPAYADAIFASMNDEVRLASIEICADFESHYDNIENMKNWDIDEYNKSKQQNDYTFDIGLESFQLVLTKTIRIRKNIT
jgi:hypothetical protein